MSTTVGAHHSGAGPLSLMSCVRESSPLQDVYEPDVEKNVITKRKFWNPKKWFRKKQKTSDDAAVHGHHHQLHQESRDVDGSRSRSTGELSTDEEPPPRNHEGSMHPGLSVSHDSVFHPLNSGSSDLELEGAQSSSSLSISQPLGDAKLQTELSSRLRLRRGRGDTSEDDEGLPRSPPCGSPAATTDSFLILEKTVNNKDLPTKSHSTCSDGSLLSMDSSEMDEDSVGLQSRHSSKMSLNEKRPEQESDLELGPSFSIAPLNHSAAHHRVSVRPKRTYGAPRRKKGQLSSALPATPEVNEDASIRSVSPDSVTTEPITELYSTSSSVHKSTSISREVKLKCHSLPAGALPPTSESLGLIRSKSNAGKSQDDASVRGEAKEEKLSLFERLFPRRSGRKKREREEKLAKMEVDGGEVKNEERKTAYVHTTSSTTTKVYSESKAVSSAYTQLSRREESKPQVVPRSGAASRQRIQPMDIPATPTQVPMSPVSPERSFSPGTSPVQAELENLFKHRQMLSTSPRECLVNTPPQSPKSPRLPLIANTASLVHNRDVSSAYSTKITYSESKFETKSSTEDIRSKIKIAGLSSLQQRVLSLNNTSDDFKSLTDFPAKLTRPISKSHSFKNQKSSSKEPSEEIKEDILEQKKSVTKASSLDSVKNLEEPAVLKSELKLTLKPVPKNTEKKVEEIEVASQVEDVSSKPIDLAIPESEDKSIVDVSEAISTFSSKTVEEHSVKTSNIPKSFSANSITISGPSHTAIVNVTSKSEDFSKSSESEVYKENQVLVTKIQLKHETTQVTKTSVTIPKSEVPEFLNKQLNKVEVRPSSNIVFSMKSPKVSPEESLPNIRPKTLFNFPPALEKLQMPRKFSKEDVEIIEKDDKNEVSSPPVTSPTTPTQSRFKKNDSKPSSRKSSVISPESPPVKDSLKQLKTRSMSLDSLKSEVTTPTDISSQDSLDKKLTEGVVMRRKSFAKQKNEDEPELMKVFARRSLKLKDGEVDQLQEAIIADKQRQRDSDKENNTETTPEVEKKLQSPKEEKPALIENFGTKMAAKQESKPLTNKQPLTEIKKSPEFINKTAKDEPEVQLRRGVNNNIFLATQRAASLNPPKSLVTDFHIKKQPSLNERRKTDQWITPKKEESIEEKEKQTDSEIISNKTEEPKEVRSETKNFSQRRAEWEKRAQQTQK